MFIPIFPKPNEAYFHNPTFLSLLEYCFAFKESSLFYLFLHFLGDWLLIVEDFWYFVKFLVARVCPFTIVLVSYSDPDGQVLLKIQQNRLGVKLKMSPG